MHIFLLLLLWIFISGLLLIKNSQFVTEQLETLFNLNDVRFKVFIISIVLSLTLILSKTIFVYGLNC